MLSAEREIALAAIILAASIAVAHAQTQDQDHAAHHPTGPAGRAAAPARSAPPGMTNPGMARPGPADGMPMMGGNMRPMMEMMRAMTEQACMGPAGQSR